MFLFSCAYAYAYVACVMLIAQVGTGLSVLWADMYVVTTTAIQVRILT